MNYFEFIATTPLWVTFDGETWLEVPKDATSLELASSENSRNEAEKE